jgi:hypothetical protein
MKHCSSQWKVNIIVYEYIGYGDSKEYASINTIYSMLINDSDIIGSGPSIHLSMIEPYGINSTGTI